MHSLESKICTHRQTQKLQNWHRHKHATYHFALRMQHMLPFFSCYIQEDAEIVDIKHCIKTFILGEGETAKSKASNIKTRNTATFRSRHTDNKQIFSTQQTLLQFFQETQNMWITMNKQVTSRIRIIQYYVHLKFEKSNRKQTSV